MPLVCWMAITSCTKTESPSIIVDKTEIVAEFTGAQETVGVKCNRDWSATADVDWITMSHSAETAFEAPSYILVTIQQNDGESRTGTISIASKSGELRSQVIVRQGENEEVIRTGEKFAAYLELVVSGKASDKYRLGADIDLAGITLPEVSELNYAFDGQDHKISNWKSGSPLFGTIGSKGSVSNLVLDSSCELTFPETEGNFGFIASENRGTIFNVVNNASASMPVLTPGNRGLICGLNSGTVSGCVNRGNLHSVSAEIQDSQISIAGVTGAGASGSKMENCSNEGEISIRIAGSTHSAFVAGVVGYSESQVTGCSNSGSVALFCESAEGKADGGVKAVAVAGVAGLVTWENGTVTGCTNTGNVSFRAGYSLGIQTVGKVTKFASNVAGVIGAAYKCSVDDCHNSGALVSRFGDIGNPASVYQTSARQSLGGIVSSPWGKVSNCKNTGSIDIDWVASDRSATVAKNFVCQAGGIVGGDYNSDTKSSSVENCTNEGNMDVEFDASGSNSTFGGISGWPGAESASGVNVVKGCVNTGNLTLGGLGKSRFGGVTGSAVKVENCRNTGTVYLKGGLTNCSVGGISGFSNFHNISGCESYGTVKSDVKLAGSESSAAGGVGGLVGAAGNTAMIYTDCKVNCSIIVPDGSAASMVMGVIGHNKKGGKTFALGTAEAPLRIKGSYNGVPVTADNYTSYMRRQGFSLVNTGVTFNVEFLQ